MLEPLTKWDIFYKFNPEDFIWAASVAGSCASPSDFRHVTPEYGMIALARTKEKHEQLMQTYNYASRHADKKEDIYAIMRENDKKFDPIDVFFVPTRTKLPNSDLNWSRASRVNSRFYAETESDIWLMFDQEVQKLIDWHRTKLQDAIRLGSPALKTANTPKAPKKSAYQAVMELKAIMQPMQANTLSQQDAMLIHQTLELDMRTNLELQDVRDMAVMLHNQDANANAPVPQPASTMDIINAITSVIDSEKTRRGMPV